MGIITPCINYGDPVPNQNIVKQFIAGSVVEGSIYFKVEKNSQGEWVRAWINWKVEDIVKSGAVVVRTGNGHPHRHLAEWDQWTMIYEAHRP